jgi:ADP-heptose:LPS heptosyltransferase
MAVARRPLLVALRALGLGDLLTAVPALRALAKTFPGHRRVLAAPASLRPLIGLIDPRLELAPTGALEPLPAAVHGAAVAVNLHGRGPQSHEVLLAAGAGRERRIWFAHPDVPESWGAPAWSEEEHERERWCRLLTDHGLVADPGDFRLPAPGSPVASGVTVIHPGAASAARRWPVERFAAAARAEHRRGHRVMITGGPGEQPLAHAIAARAGLPPSAVAAGKTDLAALALIVASADRVLSGDTGVAHLATAFGTPSVALFGPTPPARWGPPAGDTRHRVLWKGGSGDPHADRPDPGLLAIEAGEAIDALGSLPPRGD